MKPYLLANFEVCTCYGYLFSALQPDPEEEEEEEEEEREHAEFMKFILQTYFNKSHQIFDRG